MLDLQKHMFHGQISYTDRYIGIRFQIATQNAVTGFITMNDMACCKIGQVL